MKLLFLGLAGLSFVFTGCESVPQTVRDRVVGIPPHRREIPANKAKAYEVALKAAEKLGFHYIRGGPVQGELEVLTPVSPADSAQGATQMGMSIRLYSPGDNSTDVEVSVK